jgi:signal transduction histidine kinase
MVGYVRAEDPVAFVDESGRPIVPPGPSDGGVVTPMVVDGRAVGFIAHDPATLDDPRLVATISAVAELAISNAALQADLRARVMDVEASRERLVLAGDTQRQRLEQRLHGAASRLDRVSALLRGIDPRRMHAATELAALGEDVQRARGELVDFARGVHPASLTTGGLAAAIDDLARRTPIHVDVHLDTTPLDAPTGSTLYFICSEALANAGKHALADRVSIDLQTRHAAVQLTIVDDGAGGAAAGMRGGLRGLIDRVEALGGSLAIVSPRGGGTRIDVTLPLRHPDPTPTPDPLVIRTPAAIEP